MRITVCVDRGPLDELHDEIGVPIITRAAVEESGDVDVVEVGQGLAFTIEAADDLPAQQSSTDQLDGDLLLERLIGPGGEIDGSHAAGGDDIFQAIGADLPADEGTLLCIDERRRRVEIDLLFQGRLVHEIARFLLGGQEGEDLLLQVLVAATGCFDVEGPLLGRLP